ncbi:MAG: radical SAM protein [Desulfosoma sp.]|uniref:radical SAM protein n=1 Tax=Desulfosoma sp. TaxID=2603217 RepID=UPI004049C998
MFPTVRYLILWLTEGCNLRCAYCYRPNQGAPKAMSREVVDQALTLAARSGRFFHVQISGGEPTLEPDLIAYTAEALQRRRLPATLAVQTNGTRLTSELIHLFRRYAIQVGISLDGPPPIQENLRGGAAKTVAGIRRLEAAGVPFRITAVVSEASIGTLDLLPLFVGTFRWCQGIALDLLTVKGHALQGHVAPPKHHSLRVGLQRFYRSVLFVNQHRHQPLRLRELDRLRRAKASSSTSVFCPAAKGESLAVRPDGSVFPCGQTCGEKDWACGTVWHPDTTRLRRLCGLAQPRGADCATCHIRRFCPGECPSRLIYNTAHHASLVCTMYQTLWELWEKPNGIPDGSKAQRGKGGEK